MSDPVVHEPLTAAPEGCTCIWAVMVNNEGEELCGNVCISMGEDCPAWPHWRSWSKPKEAPCS